MDIRKLIILDDYIRRQATGRPEELAKKMGISRRTVHKYIAFMRNELGAPVTWKEGYRSYCYAEEGGFEFRWKSNNVVGNK